MPGIKCKKDLSEDPPVLKVAVPTSLHGEAATWQPTRVCPERGSVVIVKPKDALTANSGTVLAILRYYGLVTTINIGVCVCV